MLLVRLAPRTARGLLALVAAAAVVGSSPVVPSISAAAEPDPSNEVRALWVLRTSLASPESIASLVRSAREHGFNTLLVQVRGRGDAYFNDGIEPRAAELQHQPAGFDPLQTVLTSAHAAGLRVHAWINVNLVSSAVDLPIARQHLVYRHPDWLMVPREIAQDVAKVPAESPAYVGKLARWTRAQTGELEGLYASPIIPAAADYLQTVVRDLAKRYAVDGVHFDYARYPNAKFDYSRLALAEFRSAVRPRIEVALRQQLDLREKVDLFAYADARPDDWRAFRVSRMTSLMRRLRTVVKAERPETLVTVAVKPELREAYDDRLQDWGSWLHEGIVDVVCPMAYAPEAARFGEQISAAHAAANGRPFWAGIGAYRLSPAQTVDNIHTARKLGAAGVILFSYDSLSDPRLVSPDYLAQVARAAFAPHASSPGSR
jgi:uncharacterized lipoprotein YddW (UPF0748 family)